MNPTPPAIADLRRDYRLAELTRASVADEPMTQFRRWFDEAQAAQIVEPNAMILATVDGQGRPSTRTVLLKGMNENGFTFFTNYESRKAQELKANPRVSLTFLWKELERQVSVQGTVELTSAAESDAYFQSRPYGSQIGAHASTQSAVIPNRRWLEERFEEVSRRHPEGSVPRPANWGGYRVLPECIEFWQGRSSRLHDRLRYRKEAGAAAGWIIERLSP